MSSTQQTLSLDEFLQLPETKPACEYVDGQVVQKVSPKARHSRLQAAFLRRIAELTESNRIGLVFPELRCTFGGRSLVFDVAYFQWDRIHFDDTGAPQDDVLDAPDFVVEIIFPGQTVAQQTNRLSWCIDHGVQLAWLIDADREHVWVFQPGEAPQCRQGNDELSADAIVAQLVTSPEEIFSWLRPGK
jgi:Uma2 family endonuclease